MSIKLKKGIGNGGNGGGTTDYTSLTNKPQINGVELSGNKTSANLGLVPAPTIVTDGNASGLAVAGNRIYDFMGGSALTSLTISSVENSYYESYIIFKTGTGTISLATPNTLRWGGGNEQPQLEPNTVYCIAIRNGLAEIDNFGTTA